MVFKSTDDLFAFLQSKVTDSLQNEVFEKVRDVEQKHIDSDVYDKYTPKIYKRRDILGGLIADENIIGEMINVTTLSVRDVAQPNESLTEPPTPYNPPNDSTFAGWIENGNVTDIFHGGNPIWTKPRPFTENTIEDLESTKSHVAALKAGLKRNGIESK